MNDTPEEFEALWLRRIMARSPAERLRMGCDMFDTAKALASASLPDLRGVELRVALFERFYGTDFDERTKSAIVAHLRRVDAGGGERPSGS